METAALKLQKVDFSTSSWLLLGILGLGIYLSGVTKWYSIMGIIGTIAIIWSTASLEVTWIFLLISLHIGGTLDSRWAEYAFSGRWVFLFLFTIRVIQLALSKAKKDSYPEIFWLFIAYTLVATASVAGSFYFSFSLARTVSLWCLLISVFVVLWQYMDSRDKIVLWIKLSVQVATVFLTMSLYTMDMSDILQQTNRYAGIYSNPNMIGLALVFHVPISFYLLISEGRKQSNRFVQLFYLYSFLLGVFSLIMTGSRASTGGVFIGLCVTLSLHYRSKIVLLLLILTLMTGVIFSYFVEEAFQSNLFQGIVYRQKTFEDMSGRDKLWKTASRLFWQHPVLGWGFGTSDFVMFTGGNKSKLEITARWGTQTHSTLYRVLLETGGLGTIIFFLIILRLIMKIISVERKITNQDLNLLFLSIAAICIAGMINCFFESWLFSVGSLITFEYWWAVMVLYKIDKNLDLFAFPEDRTRRPGLF